MTPDTPNPASAIAQTGSGDVVCFGGERFSDSAPAQKYQTQNLVRRFRVRPDRARRLPSTPFQQGTRA
jgi:hypothetical protein